MNEDPILCPTCRHTFNGRKRCPRFLPCGHTFCQTCLVHYSRSRDDSLSTDMVSWCYFCDRTFPQNPLLLPINSILLCSFGFEESYLTCSICKRPRNAVMKCLVCSQYLCQVHTEDHPDHAIIDSDDDKKRKTNETAEDHAANDSGDNKRKKRAEDHLDVVANDSSDALIRTTDNQLTALTDGAGESSASNFKSHECNCELDCRQVLLFLLRKRNKSDVTNQNLNWSESLDLRSWNGEFHNQPRIFVNEADGMIKKLNFSDFGLHGKMSIILGNLTTLTTLDLSKNEITSVPTTIRKLVLLVWIDLSDNQLTSLPDAFEKMDYLQQLRVACNQLTDLPESLNSLSSLSEIVAHGNIMTSTAQSREALKKAFGRNGLVHLRFT